MFAAHVDGGALSGLRWSPDGRSLAVQTAEPAVLVLDARTLELRRVASGALGAWSPDARSMAIFDPSGGIAIVQLDSRVARVVARRPDELHDFFGGMSWSPDGRWLAVNLRADVGHHLVRIDVATGALLPAVEVCAPLPTIHSP